MKTLVFTLILALAVVSARRGRWGGGGGRHYGGHGGYWGWRPRNFCQSSLEATCNSNEKYFEQIIADVDLCNRQCPKFPYQKCHNNNNRPSQICINQSGNLTGYTVCSYCKSWDGIRNLSGTNICRLSCTDNYPSSCSCS